MQERISGLGARKFGSRSLEEGMQFLASMMRLTIEQRVAALERDNVVLHDTIKLLHKLLKEHRQLIHEYITQKVTAANESEGQAGDVRPEDALYAFVCKQRFDRIAKEVEALRKVVDGSRFGLKAG